MDVSEVLAGRLSKLENQLAHVLLLHLFVESLLNRVIEAKSPQADRVLEDNRTYSFAVKLMLVHHMGFIPAALFANIDGLNWLRNQFGHNLDANLGDCITTKQSKLKHLQTVDGKPVFPDPDGTKKQLEDLSIGPQQTLYVLRQIQDSTFAWLHALCKRAEIDLSR